MGIDDQLKRNVAAHMKRFVFIQSGDSVCWESSRRVVQVTEWFYLLDLGARHCLSESEKRVYAATINEKFPSNFDKIHASLEVRMRAFLEAKRLVKEGEAKSK